ncbi:glycine zipper domain-containing protein [Ancylobacter sp. G4_0304]|uniref:glycine zipper domain-containing protein n=1 Tax=Ancylobacter sp. G4_0304 TaxID=3114289 RepID=UPI0039C6B5F4
MTFRLSLVAAAALAVLAFSQAVPASAQSNAARGAAIGGVSGAVIGGAVTGTGRGALTGAAIGAGTGAVIGSQSRRNARSYYFWRSGNCYFRNSNGRVTRVDRRRCR